MWIPSHTNISGNEEADKLAELECKYPPSRNKGDCYDFFSMVLKKIWAGWKQEWLSIGTVKGQVYTYSIQKDNLRK